MIMARNEMIAFPRFIDRPRLILMFEADEVIYGLIVGVVAAGIVLFSTASSFLVLVTFIFCVPLAVAVTIEAKKKTGLPGAFQYIQYVAGYLGNFPLKKDKLLQRWPELKRMDHLDFVPFGFEDEFYS